MNRKLGWTCLGLFLASIPFANWWLTQHGLVQVPGLGEIPSAVWVVGIAFVLRDMAQVALGRWWSAAAIVVGCALSWWVAAPTIAFASAMAFAWSESTDALIFTPLANRGTKKAFLAGVSVSGYAASFVDSYLFIRLAFHTWHGGWQFTLAKVFFVMLATPVAYGMRQRLRPAAIA